MGDILGLYGDNAKEHGNYYSIRDIGEIFRLTWNPVCSDHF